MESADSERGPRIRFVVRRPRPALAPYVEKLWYFISRGFDHGRERVLPTGASQLLVNLDEDELRWWEGEGLRRAHRIDGAGLAGVHDRAFAIDTREQREIAGVVFRPGGAWAFSRVPASALAGEHVALSSVWGRAGATLRERMLEVRGADARLALLEATLLARFDVGRSRDAGADLDVAGAVVALERGCSIRALSEACGTSEKRLVRAFVAQVGITPKRFARVRRFQRVLAAIEGRQTSLARIAAEHGYSDHSHLVHEFRAFSGLTPSDYAPRRAGDQNHVVVED